MKRLVLGLYFCMFAGIAPVFADVFDGNRIMDQRMDENLCVLTFDDGPSKNTADLLDMLKSYGIKATFFLLGAQAVHHQDLVRRMDEEGHEIGNHSWSHPNLRKLSTENQKAQLADTEALFRSLGVTSLFMRPPYGSFDGRTVQIAKDLDLDIILWSLDSNDWRRLPADYAKLPSTRGTIYEDGGLRGVFLFHDTHRSTVDDLPRIVAHLKAGGCERFVTISEYLAAHADSEPALLMSRRSVKLPGEGPGLAQTPGRVYAPPPPPPAYAAGSGEIVFARCSKPRGYEAAQEPIRVEDAHALAPGLTGGM